MLGPKNCQSEKLGPKTFGPKKMWFTNIVYKNWVQKAWSKLGQ